MKLEWLAGASALALLGGAAQAQTIAQTVATCGTPNNTPVVGVSYPITMDQTGVICVTPVTATIGNVSVVTTVTNPVFTKGVTATGSNATTPPVLIAGAGTESTTGQVNVWLVDAAGHGQIDLAEVQGTAGNSTSQVVTVQGVAGGTPVATATAGDSYVHITTATTTTVGATGATLKKVSVNTKGTVASTTTTKCDATTLAVIDSLNLTGTWDYNIACAGNLTIVTTGTAAPDVTATYR